MRIVMMACTARGFASARRCARLLEPLLPETQFVLTGHSAHEAGFENTPPLSVLTEEWFGRADALVFFTAAGIAVRCIAPFLQDKFSDPAVLVIDENAKYVIPLLSGHAGGANRLCRLIAQALDSQPVITTATDGRGLFAVDVYAQENGLKLSDRIAAKEISARLLAGETVKVYADRENGGCLPAPPASYGKGAEETDVRADADIILSVLRKTEDSENALYLIPRIVTLGIGCRRGIPAEMIRSAVQRVLEESGVFRQALSGAASIDIKQNEEGLNTFAGEWKLPLTFYTAEQLEAAEGIFTPSSFVKEVTGVDNVCERSAVLLAGRGGALLAGKRSSDGVTAALGISLRETFSV